MIRQTSIVLMLLLLFLTLSGCGNTTASETQTANLMDWHSHTNYQDKSGHLIATVNKYWGSEIDRWVKAVYYTGYRSRYYAFLRKFGDSRLLLITGGTRAVARVRDISYEQGKCVIDVSFQFVDPPKEKAYALLELQNISSVEVRQVDKKGQFIAEIPLTVDIIAPKDKELLNRYHWSVSAKLGQQTVTMPGSFTHEPGTSPVPIYWAYNNELSKDIGLDMSLYLGKKVIAHIFLLNEPLVKNGNPNTTARAVIVKYQGKTIGAFVSRWRSGFGVSLRRRDLNEITGLPWSQWLVHSNVVDPKNSLEEKLARMGPEKIIATYIEAVSNDNQKLAQACLTRRRLSGILFENMYPTELYNKKFPDDNIKSLELIKIEPYPIPDENIFKVDWNVQWKDSSKTWVSEGAQVRFCTLRKEIQGLGWRIDGFGTGP